MDKDVFLELTVARFRGVMAAAMLTCGKPPTGAQMRTFRADAPTVRDMADLFREADTRIGFHVTPMTGKD